MNDMLRIEGKITGYEVVKPNEKKPLPDDDPLLKRIEKRPVGELAATCEKLEYSTQEGKKTIYFIISYMPVPGVVNGEEVVIERPIEFFLPASQSVDDQQWITATMRSLSLAARGGYAAKALMDLRSVNWTKGPVRCGVKEYNGNKKVPIHHDSVVAAIAWAIQQALHRRGFLDVEGNQVPARILANAYKKQATETVVALDAVEVAEPELQANAVVATGPTCPQCGGTNVVRMDGCDTCRDCGHSKCG